jgi:hypothetical protein
MTDVIKGIGKVVSAPVRGIGHALGASNIPLISNVGRAAENVGNAFAGKGSFLGDIGQAGEEAAPVLGMIPGVGPLAAGVTGGLGGILHKGLNSQGLGEGLRYGAEGALSGLGSKLFAGGTPGSSDTGFLRSLGKSLKGAFTNPDGSLNLEKAISAGGSVANMIGAGKQRKSAEDYANAQIGQRNALMSKILGPQNYGIPAPNLNQQSSTTPAGGSGY